MVVEHVSEEPYSVWDMEFGENIYGTKKVTVTKVGKYKEEKMSDYFSSLEDDCFDIGSPVEICTPVLGYDTHEKVIETMLTHASKELDLQFNTTCGLHVHVGCGKRFSWSLEELKSIAKAVVLWEVCWRQSSSCP